MTPPRTRITLVVTNIACGGIQRVSVWLAAGLLARGYSVSVITLAAEDTDFFELPLGVPRFSVGLRGRTPSAPWRLPGLMLRRQRRLRELIDFTEPDVVIARAPDAAVQTLFAMRGLAIPIVATEHGDKPVRQRARPGCTWRNWLWYKLRRLAYRRAAKVVSVCHGVDQTFRWLPTNRRSVIHNPYKPEGQASAADSHSLPTAESPFILSIGRLSHEKGYDVLLQSFALVCERFPDWRLVIAGDGELSDVLPRRADELRLQKRVSFIGAVPNPAALLARAQLFALASRYEGFPNAHLEALAHGVPVVATECPCKPPGWRDSDGAASGVSELVRHGVDGLLVPPNDPIAFAAALADLMGNEYRRREMSRQAVSVRERFAPDKALDAWEQVIAQTGGAGEVSHPRDRTAEAADHVSTTPFAARSRR
jgi:GalNAc-alpha-(1->4)-GalNAc-alpha-(1->3)-diNAcBac-PP-undecaprenol alpha-1,4-N-acetyl-D-galactosaminyltransferase